ncbi:MAG TPA: pitrilysin family protein [Flavilitoribacter sp.]|nr:pitrilysin family protein [Flavilitoribacter sp.]HMQ86118.1 pitrilysin family protein [Flavilitoribacter sp.]
MIDFTRFTLDNGMRLLVHVDTNTPMAAFNLMYNVGSRDESPDKTGFAHLFEHLMFGGSVNAPDFDDPIQLAGGENNAFTNNDVTSYYQVLPAENLETAFWLESDRMLNLSFDRKVLNVQRKVVVEEFKETCLNEPYGDVFHHLSEMAYKVHPYRWPTIGLVPEHVEKARMADVRSFFGKHYRPNNAVLVVCGNVEPETVRAMAVKWFGDIPAGKIPVRDLPAEPPQKDAVFRIARGNVPNEALYLAFHCPARMERDYYVVDLLSDILGNGPSSRLYRRLLKERELFTSVDCYITGSADPGLFIIEGKPAEGVTLEKAEDAIWEEIAMLRKELVPDRELEKIKNKAEATLIFSELSVLNKAINLAFFEILGDGSWINEEEGIYNSITATDLRRMAGSMLVPENCSRLYYKPKEEQQVEPVAAESLAQ